MLKSKKLLAQLLAFLIVGSFILGACSQPTPTTAPQIEPTQAAQPEATSKPAETQPTEGDSEEVVQPDPYGSVDPSGETVVFWHNHTGSRQTFLDDLVADFNATNEWGITVEHEYQGSYADIYNKVLSFLNTEDVPNLVVAYQNNAASYQLADGLTDMTPLVNSPTWGLTEEEQADFFPGFFSQDIFPIFDNARLGIPPNRSMEVLFYNMDWLKELGYDAPPTTPEEFKEMSCKASEQPFSNSQATDNYGLSFTNDASNTASWIFAFGGNIYNQQTNKYTYDTPEAKAVMNMMQDMFDEGCAVLVTERYGEQTDFATGRSLFTMGSSSGLPFYQSAIEGAANFDWSVSFVPHTTAEPVMNIYGASVSIPRSTPEKELATWLFVKEYTSPEVNAAWGLVSNYFPVRASAAAALEEYFAENPIYKTAFDLLPYGIAEPPVPGYDPVRDKVAQAAAAIVDGADVDATLATLDAEANDILAEQMALVPEPSDPWWKVDPTGQTVTFWHNHSSSRETFLTEIIDEFNATNPWGITVEHEYQGSYSDIYNKMINVLNTTEAPDLVVAYQNNAASYQVVDGLVDMTSLVKSPRWGLSLKDEADFFKGFFGQDVFPTFDNARLGFPPNRSMEVVFYNMDWLKEMGFDAPPTTPEEFTEMACKASEQPFSKSVATDSYGMTYANDASNFASWVFAFGGDIYDSKNNQYTYNSEAAIAAMELMQSLVADGCVTMGTERYQEQTDFGLGRSLFAMGSTSGLPFYQDAVDAGGGFEWSVTAVPHTTENPVQNIYGASISMPKTTPERELATWLFVKYFTSPEINAEWALVSNYFPVRASAADSLGDYFAENPTYKTAFDLLQYGKFEPPVPGYDPVRDLVSIAVAAITDGADVAATLEQLNADANAILAEQLEMIP